MILRNLFEEILKTFNKNRNGTKSKLSINILPALSHTTNSFGLSTNHFSSHLRQHVNKPRIATVTFIVTSQFKIMTS